MQCRTMPEGIVIDRCLIMSATERSVHVIYRVTRNLVSLAAVLIQKTAARETT